MNLFLRRKITASFFIFLLVSTFIFLNGCASYKAEPLEDFTEQNTYQTGNQ